MRGRLNALLSVAALVAAPTAVAQTQVDAVQADRDAKSLLEANPALEYDPTSVLVRFHDDTPEALRAHPRLAKFAAWVARRPHDFHSKTPGARRGWKRR